MNNQTAVEWYETQRKKLIQDYTKRSVNGMDLYMESQKLFEQAKQMDKEQKRLFFDCGRNFQLTGENTFEQVYNETYEATDNREPS